MGGVARLRGLAVLLRCRNRPPAVVPADPPHRPIRHVPMPGGADFIGEEPIPELGIVPWASKIAFARQASSSFGVGDRLV